MILIFQQILRKINEINEKFLIISKIFIRKCTILTIYLYSGISRGIQLQKNDYREKKSSFHLPSINLFEIFIYYPLIF